MDACDYTNITIDWLSNSHAPTATIAHGGEQTTADEKGRQQVHGARSPALYRLIKLENGLHATVIHDAKPDKAAASLDLAVGHLLDPVRSLSPCSIRCPHVCLL
jgi:insulysin